MSRPLIQAPTLLERVDRRERRALAQLITQLDDGLELSDLQTAASHRAMVIGLTGAAGVGKSSLIGALVKHLRSAGRSVAVLMCDPSSPISGGAVLGDRVRIEDDPADEKLFIRSLATRGGPGGLSQATRPIVRLLDRFGFDVILIETIGVGQDQVAVRSIADTVVLVLTPQSGDEMQWQKAGIMECADLIAVNKADLGGAEMIARSLHAITSAPVFPVSAETSAGVGDLWNEIDSVRRAS